MDFEWSLKPIFIWLVMTFGIDLNRSRKTAMRGKCFTTLLCLFWFVGITVPLNMFCIAVGISMKDEPFSLSFVYNVNYRISWILTGILDLSFHASVLFSTFGKWESLWKKLQQLQDVIDDDCVLYPRLRHHAVQGLIIVSTVNVTT